MLNIDTFIDAYTKSFIQTYPEMPIATQENRVAKFIEVLHNKGIRHILLNSPALKLTCKSLNIRHSYKDIELYLAD